jgi:hypothetical protein
MTGAPRPPFLVQAVTGRDNVQHSYKMSPYARSALWIFLSFSIFYVAITRGHFINTMEIAVYQTTRSIWEEGNFSTGHIHDTHVGRYGRYYAQFSAGQSLVSLPLYGLGKTAGLIFKKMGRNDWRKIFAGPSIGREPSRWGGDIEIFSVNLLNAFITALLCSVFFAFSLRLGASIRWALASTALLGLTTYIGPFSTGFLQHSSEALFLLWTFYLLFSDQKKPDWRRRFAAGATAGLMPLFRFPSIAALPALGLYLLWTTWKRKTGSSSPRSLQKYFRSLFPFAISIGAALFLHLSINYLKFGTIWGKYLSEGFQTPLLKGLYGLLLSPGNSILLFTPLLILSPWLCRYFYKESATETIFVIVLAGIYLVFYGKYTAWHGDLPCPGPRYIMPIIPVLLLPLAKWMGEIGRKAWLAIGPLAVIGFWVQLVVVAVNFSYVSHYEKYPAYRPPYSFLFIPSASPIVAHSKALLAADYRVDMWLVNVYRSFGLECVLFITLPLALLFALCLWRLWRNLQISEELTTQGIEPSFSIPSRSVLSLVSTILMGMLLMIGIDVYFGPVK